MSTPSIIQSVNAKVGAKAPAGFSGAATKDLVTPYIHAMLYGETDSRKTTTAASFGGPERTFILLTRSPEQLIPIAGQNYRYARIENGDALLWALQFPEKAADAAGFPEWKDLPDRVLVIDDMTEGTNMLVDDNATRDDGTTVRDGRQIYKAVNDNLREVLAAMKRKQMHVIHTALAKVAVSQIANEETVYPDMPTGARSIITADLEYIFYMKRSTGKMLTSPDFLTFTKIDDKGKPVSGKRDIFAKHKLPKELVGRTPPVLSKEEPMDLAAVWRKVCDARAPSAR
jgi:hypothetical protein